MVVVAVVEDHIDRNIVHIGRTRPGPDRGPGRGLGHNLDRDQVRAQDLVIGAIIIIVNHHPGDQDTGRSRELDQGPGRGLYHQCSKNLVPVRDHVLDLHLIPNLHHREDHINLQDVIIINKEI